MATRIVQYSYRIRNEAAWRKHANDSHEGPFLFCTLCWPTEAS